jgi:hypothetical protein
VSGVILVVIVGMWAALLVPMWLRRHEEADQLGSIDRFSAAMRILSRQDRQMGSRSLVMPRRESVAVSAPKPKPISERPVRPALPVSASRARLLARRRRVMTVLAGLVLFTLLLAVVGVLSFWWQGVVDLALVAYVAHLRAEAVRAAELRETRAGRGAARVVEEPSWATAAPAPAEATSTSLQPPHDAEEVFAQPGMEPGWEPTPVPLPTYVTAPVAPRPAVRILDDDLGLEVFIDEDEVEEIVSRRRAVNE